MISRSETRGVRAACRVDSAAAYNDPARVIIAAASASYAGAAVSACRVDCTAVDGNRSLVVNNKGSCTDTCAVFRTGRIDHASVDRDVSGCVVIAADARAGRRWLGDVPCSASYSLPPYGQRTSSVDRHSLRVRKRCAVAEYDVDTVLSRSVVADAVVVGNIAHNSIPAVFKIGLISDDPCGGDSLLVSVQVGICDLDSA